MGLSVVLEGESGEELERVDDYANLLHRLLPDSDNKDYILLGAIDWYGDTTFNYLQAARFLDEWHRMGSAASSDAERDLIRSVARMAQRLQEELHVYLKFYGD